MQKNNTGPLKQKMEDTGAADQIARKYLDLWIEHWSASLAAPETATYLARMIAAVSAWPAAARDHAGFAGAAPGQPSPDQPAPVPPASGVGGERLDELESRIAALERRLAETGAAREPALAEPAARAGSRARKNRPAGA
jgi:hypothetical protein